MMHDCEELWISRAIDRTASAEDWRGLETIAAADRDVWRRLCVTLQEDTLLAARVSVLLPPGPAAVPLVPAPGAVRGVPRPVAMLLAAALVAMVFWLGRSTAQNGDARNRGSAAPRDAVPANHDADVRTDQLLGAYLAEGAESGRVLEQLPLHTLATERLPGSDGLEVVFVRSLVERRHVGQAFALAADEHGRPAPLAVDLSHYVPPSNH
jgi:hypothetical protein